MQLDNFFFIISTKTEDSIQQLHAKSACTCSKHDTMSLRGMDIVKVEKEDDGVAW